MRLFAILILCAVPYLVSCSSENSLGLRKNDSYGAAHAQSVKEKSPAAEGFPKDQSSDLVKAASRSFKGKAIDLPHYPPDFPPGAGRELFMTRCGMCHSLRYVTMQPNFTKKAWAKEVDKMIKTYGAHIDKQEAQEITEYLFSVKGKP